MGRSFNTMRRTGTTVPRIQAMVVKTGETFKPYAVVVNDDDGLLVECADGATSVLGVALEGAFAGPGYDLPNSARTNTLVQGASPNASVAIADREQEFSARGVNGGTDPVLPLQTHIGEQYGIKKVVNDWVIDFSNVTDLCVEITDIFPAPEGNFFGCKFLESVLVRP